MNFNSDDLWYSKIDLNKENGKIQRPIVPTLRVAKVIKHNNQKVGMLIVNIFMKNFLESLPKSTLYDIYLVDKDGYFILHPNNVYSWSKYLGQDYMLNNKFPKYYENILVSDEYHQYDIYSKVLNINNNENIRMIFVPKLDSMEAEFGQYSFIIVAVLIIVLLISIPLAYLLSHKPSQLKNEVDNLNDEIIDTQKEILATMGGIAESRCKETGNHINRVAEYSALLAHHYGLDETEVDMIRMATPMHDIGKVAIPDSVLHKPGKFDEVERIIMNNHSQLGYDMLKHSDRYIMQTAALIAYQHHERWDGEGYPQGLMEENIHIYGRIAAVADVFDALGSHRVYKSAWDDDKIFKLFKEERGKQFDPKLIDIFFDNIDEFLEIRETFKD